MQLSRDSQQYLDLFRFQRKFLESVFGEKWFRKPRRDHPAYLRWELIGKYLERDGLIDRAANPDEMTSLGRALLDTHLLVALAGGNLETLDPGDFSAYGNAEMQHFLKKRLPIKDFFEDVMCEVAFAGWHRSIGRKVEPDQREGMPDLRLDLPPWVVADCKRLTSDNLNSLKNHLKKANAQVSAYNRQHKSDHPGLVILDISTVVKVGTVSDNSIPAAVVAFEDNVKRLLHGPYSSLSGALLLWDDLIVEQEDPKTWYRFRRRFRQVPHRAPKQPLPSVKLFEQIEIWNSILWWKPLSPPLEVRKSVEFEELEQRLQVDPNLMMSTYFQPDDVQILFFNKTTARRFTLFLKHFPEAQPACSLLLGVEEWSGGDGKPNQASLQFAFPLRSAGKPFATPRRFLWAVADRYGQSFSFQGEKVRILDGVQIPRTRFEVMDELNTARSGHVGWFYAGLSADETNPTSAVRIPIAIFLDLNRYAGWKSEP